MGGAEIVLLRYLKNNDSISPVILLPQGKLYEIMQKEGYKLYKSRGLGALGMYLRGMGFLKLILRLLAVTLEIGYICYNEKPFLIHGNSFHATVYSWFPSKLMRKPLIWHMHDIFPIESLKARICKLLGKRVAHIISVSSAVKAQLVRFGVSDKKVSVIYNGIDYENTFNPNNYVRGKLRKEYHLSDPVILIGMVGLIARLKGFHLFLEAIAQNAKSMNSRVRYFIIGESLNRKSEYKRSLLEYAKEKRLENLVFFTGKRDDVPAVLKDLDVLVHASIWEDSLPTVILEAMAMGKIVIASRNGGVPEIIDDYVNGILFNPGDIEDLAGKIEWVIHNLGESKNFSIKARAKIIEKFSEATKRQRTLTLYDAINDA